MKGANATQAELGQAAGASQPVAFDGLLGWLHDARGRRGVVICNGLGYQSLCCQPAFRALADRIAAAGLPCLRFDYPSEGDSLGQFDDPDRVAAWLGSATAAVDWLAGFGDIEEIALVGFGFGALAALDAAARRRDLVTRMVLLAPPASGRALVRQMRAEAAMVAAKTEQPFETEGGGLSIAGFEFSPETLDQLGRLSLNPEAAPEKLLVLAPSGAPQSLESRAETRKFAGYTAMLGVHILPHVPHEDWAQVADWLAQDAPVAAATPRASAAPGVLTGENFSETALRFGSEGELAGVLCTPAQGDACAILLNTGANAHIGWARGAVTISRRLASEAGIAALRMDLRGIGESALLAGGPLSALYVHERIRDVNEAVAMMKGLGYRRITLVGQCSGAFAALHTALRNDDVTSLVLVNLVRFALHEDETVEMLLAQSERSTDGYISMLRTGAALRRMVRGKAPLRGFARAARKIGHRGLLALGETLASMVQLPPKSDTPEAWLHQLSARGVATHFLFSEMDISRDEFARCVSGEWRARRIAGLQRGILKGADHTLSARAARSVLFDNVRSATSPNPPKADAPEPAPFPRPMTASDSLGD